MDNSNPAQNRVSQPAQNQQASLIRLEQVRKLPHLNDQQKAQHEHVIGELWNTLNSEPAGSKEHTQAYHKLSQISNNLMQAMKRFQQTRQQQMAQQAQAGQQVAAAPRPAQPNAGNVSFHQLTPAIQDRVNQARFAYPPAMVEGTKPAEDWLKEAKARYGHALQRSEIAKQKKDEFERQKSQREASGNPLTSQESQVFASKVQQCMKAISESESFMTKFKDQQAQFRQQTLPRFTNQAPGPGPDNSDGPTAPGLPAGGAPGPTAHSITSAVSAARSQANTTQESPSVSQAQLANSSTPVQINGSTGVNPSPYHQQTPSMDAINGLHRPLSHQGPQPTQAQSATSHAHPANYLNPAKKDDRHPITKNMQVQPPKAVEMPPSRPTLSGGPNVGMPGQMAMPAIATYPGYVLESSEDGRLLSKKKLNELVREVCGPGSEEQLTPEVEEIFLQITDDFVDDLISAACKLARLRGSQQLETRDIQVILERQYNIRIPGYSTDEIRTVRRSQPAPGWAHKMAAVQAAKLTGGGTANAAGANGTKE